MWEKSTLGKKSVHKTTRWWFQTILIFILTWGMIQFDQNIFEMDWFNHHLEEGQPNLQLREEISLSPKIDPGRWESSLKSMFFFYRKVFPCYKIPFRKRLWFNQKSGMNDPPLVLLTSLFLRVLMRTPTSNPLNFHFQMVGVGRFQGCFLSSTNNKLFINDCYSGSPCEWRRSIVSFFLECYLRFGFCLIDFVTSQN